MAELPASPLPRSPEYWDRLARAVRDDAAGPLGAYADAHDGAYAVLARRAPWLIAASAAAMLLLWLALPVSKASVAHRWMEQAVAPRGAAGTLLAGPAPPSVDAVLVEFPPAAVEEVGR